MEVYTTTAEKIIAKHYVATEQDVELLAKSCHVSDNTLKAGSTTFLRVVICAMQAELGPAAGARGAKRKPGKQAQLQVLANVNGKFYPAVLRGVTTTDVINDPSLDHDEQRRRTLERNRRSVFARSTISTIKGYINRDGDIRVIDLNTVTKGALRGDKSTAGADPSERLARSVKTIRRVLTRLARSHVARAIAEGDLVLRGIRDIVDEVHSVAAIRATDVPTVKPAPKAAEPERHEDSTILPGYGNVSHILSAFDTPVPQLHKNR